MKQKFSKIKYIIDAAKKGKIFILVDDESRENEGDLIIPASKVSPKSINFMAKHGRGLICLALTQNQVNKLNLPLMSPSNNSRTQTAFTVSIEAKKGVTTGISAHRAGKPSPTCASGRAAGSARSRARPLPWHTVRSARSSAASASASTMRRSCV